MPESSQERATRVGQEHDTWHKTVGGTAEQTKGPPLLSITPDTITAGVTTDFVLIGEGFEDAAGVVYRFIDVDGDWDRWPDPIIVSDTEIHVTGLFVEARPIEVGVRNGTSLPVGTPLPLTVNP